ncbi:MAG: hypothetical protein U9Q70_13560 [Chloroflexota bacterium]|nr:hypothetical protein [Chloroflexota bacterium]
MQKRYLWLLVSVLLVLSLGCSLGSLTEKAQEVGEQAEELAEQAQELAEDAENLTEGLGGETEAEAGESVPEAEADAEEIELDAAALAGLDSYRTIMIMRFETEDGTVEETQMEMAATRDPAAHQIIMTGGFSADGSSMEIIQIGNHQWMKMGEEWMQTELSDEDVSSFEDNLPFSPDDVQEDMLEQAEYQGKETVNGIHTRHYLLDKQVMEMMGAMSGMTPGNTGEVESAKMELWIANQSGLPAFTVRMESAVEGMVMEDEEVTSYFMSWNVTDINTDMTIEPPAEATSGGLPDDIPGYPNATNETVMMGMISFGTADDFDTVVDFYAAELVSAGWSKAEGGMSMEGLVMDTWTKDERTLQLNITTDEDTGEVSVMLMVEGEE